MTFLKRKNEIMKIKKKKCWPYNGNYSMTYEDIQKEN